MKIFKNLILAIFILGACSKAVRTTYGHFHPPAQAQP
jgi:hypothetical protein